MRRKKTPLKFGGGDGQKNINDNQKISEIEETPENDCSKRKPKKTK